MLNTIHIHKTEHVPYEKTIIEQRAPTDESIKIFDDLQQRAVNRVVKSFDVKDNILNAVVVYFVHSFHVDKLEFICKFSFNGVEHQFKGEINTYELINSKYGSNAVAVELGKRACFMFADNVMKEIPELSKHLGFSL